MLRGNGFDLTLDERLRRAEEAEMELQRLQPMAEEAPKLRATKAKLEKRKAQEKAKEALMNTVVTSVDSASNRQSEVPQLLDGAGRAIRELYEALREIDRHRREATDCLTKIDRIDYEIELEQQKELEEANDRDTRGLAYAVAAHHGDARVKGMLNELDPDFGFVNGCDLTNPLVRDTLRFVMGHALSATNVELEEYERAIEEAMEPAES